MGFELKRDEPVHCIETMTGRDLSGTLELGTKSLHADIYSFTETFRLPDDGPIHLRTSNNRYVSLYENIVGLPGHTYAKGPPELVTYHGHVISNCAVVGPRFWQPDDRVKRVTFRIPHAEQILRNRAHLEKLRKLGEQDALLSAQAGDSTLRVWYSAIYGAEFDTPKEHWPTVELEFAVGIPLEQVMGRVYDVVELFALSLWTPLRPDDVRVCRLSNEEVHAAVKAQTYLGDHAVELVWQDKEVDRSRVWAGASFVASFEEADLRTTENCLAAWLARRDEWYKANAMMMQVLALEGQVTADRLIAACRWLEEIPQAAPAAALSNDAVEAIARAAAEKAEALGHTGLLPRITGALRVLKRETHESRFARQLASVGDTFSLKRFTEEALPHLVRAQRLRGTAAHGHFGQQTEQEFRDCYNAILATEALCMLLTAQALPLDERSYDRTRSHRALEAFLLAYK